MSATDSNPATTPQKTILKSADADPSIAEKKDSVPPAGGASKPTVTSDAGAVNTDKSSKDEQPAKLSPTQGENSKGGEGEDKEKEGGGQSEALVRDSYLPTNKLKDAPSASHYEGKNPEDFMKTKGPGLGEQIGQKMHDLKDKVTPHKDK